MQIPKDYYDEQITALRQHRYKAKAKLEEIQKDSEDVWKDLKQGLENTWTAFEQGFE